MNDMPPAVERPLTPPGWGGTANGWGRSLSPGPWDRDTSANAWGANAAGGDWGDWGANTGVSGWGSGAAAPSANAWDDAAATGGGWGDSAGGWDTNGAAAGGWGVGNAAGSSSATIIPPPPGASYATGAGQRRRGQTNEQDNSWNRYPSGYPNDRGHMNSTASRLPVHDSSFSSNSAAAYPHPYQSSQALATQGTRHPSGFDASHYASLRHQALSDPLDVAYMQPSWATPIGASPFSQQSSSTDSMALIRRPSLPTAVIRPNVPFNYSPASSLGRSPSGTGYGGFPDRPSEWRKGFSMRSGLASMLPRPRQQRSLSYGDSSNQQRPALHPFLHFTFGDPPVSYDLRFPIHTISFRDVMRDIVESDLRHRLACEPPLPYMRLIHPRLPWYIDVHASNATGVDLGDLFQAIWDCLRCPIQTADFWNDELTDHDREKISRAWRARCNGDAFERSSGVRRVDFLRRHVVFEGLVKGRNGTWEMKTRKARYSD